MANNNNQHPNRQFKPFRKLTEEEKFTGLSKTLSYLLRHGAAKEGLKIYKGGYCSVDEILSLNQMRKYTRKDIDRVVQESTSMRQTGEKRFQGVTINNNHFIRATYAISEAAWDKDEEIEFPTEELFFFNNNNNAKQEPKEVVPKLSKLCLGNIVKNIKMYDSFTGLNDGYILECIMTELKLQNKLNNNTLKGFLIPDMDVLDLGSELFISDATLRRIGTQCTGLRKLRLAECVSLTDTNVQFIMKRCTQLRTVEFIECKYITDAGLAFMASLGKELRSVILQGLPSITPAGLDAFFAKSPNLQSLTLTNCEKITSDCKRLGEKYPNLKQFVIRHTLPTS